VARGDLTNAQWGRLEAVLPEVRMGRPPRDRRVVIDAIRWRVRTGSPWRDMPERYGPWETVSFAASGPGRRGNTVNRTRVQAHAWLNADWEVDAVDLTQRGGDLHPQSARQPRDPLMAPSMSSVDHESRARWIAESPPCVLPGPSAGLGEHLPACGRKSI
jgi:transposase